MNPQTTSSAARIDIEAIRAKLDSATGQQFWQSPDELAETAALQQILREFPDGASEWDDGLNRRNFLKIAAASLALAGLTGCTKQPNQKILPYVKQPEELVPGEPLYYATTMPFGGYGTWVLVQSRGSHPIQVHCQSRQ